jgi:hypothetical protein
MEKNIYKIGKELFITSDEEIKFNDYITDGYKVWQWKDDSSLLGRKKIILTTDQELIKDGGQAIDDEFLEWFVKNPSCEVVKVDHERVLWEDGRITHYTYKIIIPKEEPKQTDWKESTKVLMEAYGDNPKDFTYEQPKQDYTALLKEVGTKQETLEEVAENECKYLADWKDKDIYKKGFLDCAKWQQQQNKNLYSEEDVHKIIESYQNNIGNNPILIGYIEWFEQFKKK